MGRLARISLTIDVIEPALISTSTTSNSRHVCAARLCRHSRRRCGRRTVRTMTETVGFNVARYSQSPGTGMTNFTSFSAMKFSVVLAELPFSSFFSVTITSFVVDLRLRQTFPLGPSCGVVAFPRHPVSDLTKSILETLSPSPFDCIIL